DLFYFAEAFLMSFERRDFLRDAVFFLMSPRFAALSIALYASESFACAALASVVTSSRVSLIVALRVRERRRLNTCLRFEPRRAFFADWMIGMGNGIWNVEYRM